MSDPAPRLPTLHWLLWAAVLALGAMAPLLAILASGHTLAWSDTAQLFGPMRGLIGEALREFRLPLWNPYEAMGTPLFAQLMHGVLHAVSVAAAFLHAGTGTDGMVVAYVGLAAVGAGVLASSLGASRPAAVVAGLAYALSGYVLGMTSVLPYLAGGATAPWGVAALRRAGSASRTGLALGAVAIACSHFAGDPQWTIVTVALGMLLAVEANGVRGVLRAAAVVAIGTLIAAVQLLPAFAYLEHTTRSEGLSAFDRTEWAFSPFRVVEFFAPGFFAPSSDTLSSPVFQWLGSPQAPVTYRPFVPSVAIGAAVLVFAGAGTMASRAGRWLLWAALVFLWVALGWHAGAEQLLGHVPIWGAFRYSEKLVGPFTLCVAVLGALGVEHLARGGRSGVIRLTMIATAASGVLALVLLGAPALERLAVAAPPEAASAARRVLGLGLLHAAGSLALLAALLAARERLPWLARRFREAAAGLVFLSSASASGWALHVGVRGVRDEAPLAAERIPGRVTRVVSLRSPPFANPLRLRPADLDVAAASRMAAPSFNVASRIDQMEQYSGLLPTRWVRFGERLGPMLGPSALSRFGRSHIVVRSPWNAEEAKLAAEVVTGGRVVETNREWGYSVWEMPHRPWARFARAVASARSEDEVLNAIAATERAGADVAIVEGEPPTGGTAEGQVLSIQRSTEWLRLEAVASGDAFLVVNDTLLPGWHATLDGAPVPLFRTDYLARGLSFPSGRHVVEMRYEPREVKVGAAITVAGLLAAVLLAASPLVEPILLRGLRAWRGK